MTTSYTNVSSASALSADIKAIDQASAADKGNGTNYSITLTARATLTESADIDAINLTGKDTLLIDGEGAYLNGANAFRDLFAYSGATTIYNLTIENAVSKGGAGGGSFGGGGAGLGGGLFVAYNSGAGGAVPAKVELDDVSFTGDSAIGGGGGGDATGIGGGGLGGGGVGSSGFRGSDVGAGGGGFIPGPRAAPAGGTGGRRRRQRRRRRRRA
jgi:hypothetical protein